MSGHSGKLQDPEFRRERARRAARARTGIDYHIDKIVRDAPPLTKEQAARLAALLRPCGGGR